MTKINAIIEQPKQIVRTTLDQVGERELPYSGIYILAYMGRILYVGKAEESIEERLIKHLYQPNANSIGAWLHKCADWANIRLDVLEPPNPNDEKWILKIEEACVRQFRPLFNVQFL